MATKLPTVADAAREAQEARALFEDLDSRLRNGDAGVTLKAYEAAQVALNFAEKKLEGVRVREAREAQERQRVAVQEMQAEMKSALGKTTPKIVSAYEDAQAALVALAQAVETQNATRHTFHTRAAELHSQDGSEESPFPSAIRKTLDIGLGHEAPFVKLLPLVDAAIYQAFMPDHVGDLSHDERERVRLLAGPPVEAVREIRVLAEYLGRADADDQNA